MVKVFRILIVSTLALLLVAAVLPLARPVHVSIGLNQALPPWVVASFAILPIAVAVLLASGGLFFFKQWGRWLGLLVAVSTAVVVFLLAGSPVAAALSQVVVALLVLSALFWVVGLLASCHPAVRVKFRHER